MRGASSEVGQLNVRSAPEAAQTGVAASTSGAPRFLAVHCLAAEPVTQLDLAEGLTAVWWKETRDGLPSRYSSDAPPRL